MRDCDRGILQQLLTAHSAIADIREQQKCLLQEPQDNEQLLNVFALKETLDNVQEDFQPSGNNDYYLQDKIMPDIPPNGLSKTALNSANNSEEDDILLQFFGDKDITRLECLSKPSNTEYSMNVREVDGGCSAARRELEQEKTTTNNGKTLAELKVEAKKEGRSSMAFEMQLLRQKLQEEAKSELAAFDKEFDSTSDLSTLLETEKKSYRHSILNRMDELLNPPSHDANQSGQCTHRSGNHIRQYSEPVVLSDMVWNESMRSRDTARDNSPKSTETKGSYLSTSQSTQFFHNRKHSEPAHSSFRIPSSRTHVELTRTGSGSLNKYEDDSVKRCAPVHQNSQTHYDTTVVKRRSSSSRNNTLEKKPKHTLQYSVESLNGDEIVATSPTSLSNGGITMFQNEDFDSPEHKSILGKLVRNGFSRSPFSETTSGLLLQENPTKVPHVNGKSHSPEVYPEISPYPPPLSPANRVTSPPYLRQDVTYQQTRQNPSGGRKGALSTPLKKNFLTKSSENSWL